MHGLVFEIFEDWIVEEYGIEAWHAAKANANCGVKDKSFITRAYYSDETYVRIVATASDLMGTSADDGLERFGKYVVGFLFSNGYGSLLKCQGSTLRQWLSNLNAMHDHIQKSFPGGKFCPPVFWCEDCEEFEGSILLHYFSQRGTLFVPLVVGIVEELASYHFQVEVKMSRIALQDENGSKISSWRITAVDETQTWKLSPSVSKDQLSSGAEEASVDFDTAVLPTTCPFSGRQSGSQVAEGDAAKSCPYSQKKEHDQAESILSPTQSPINDNSEEDGLSMRKLREVFPFHVVVDRDFRIHQVGQKLPDVLGREQQSFSGVHIQEIFRITRPVLATSWDWRSMNQLSDQHFFLSPTVKGNKMSNTRKSRKRVSISDGPEAKADDSMSFKACLIPLSADKVMFCICPDVNGVAELINMGLTLSDLSLATSQRDAVFLSEYVQEAAGKAHALDKLSRTLRAEQTLSNSLLYNMLPKKVADELRMGKTIEPMFHENVTLFFSDIEGFTKLCDQVEPWSVIDMMNQLYSVMDFLADRFNLYKVETVGDSYMCCSGLPDPDPLHSENVANFALAVVECAKHVKSPVTGKPIKLRIGIHTGSCTAGVVGTMTPHYCLFGDMVNATSRHESSGTAGKVHCSSDLFHRLKFHADSDAQQYEFKPRGLVDMKGKGEQYTYWLENGTGQNAKACPAALKELSTEVEGMIASEKWKMRRYFRNGGLMSDTASFTSATASTATSADSFISDQKSTASSQASLHSDQSCGGSVDEMLADTETEGDVMDAIVCFTEAQVSNGSSHWKDLELGESLSQDELQYKVYCLLFSSLKTCVSKGGSRLAVIDEQLRLFVGQIADLYNKNNSFHNFSHAAKVCVLADFLWDLRWGKEDHDPWSRFILLFAALSHDAKHSGASNSRLEVENDLLFQQYANKGSYQQRNSFDCAFEILEEEHCDLYEEIMFGCPTFRTLSKKMVLCTDLESRANFRLTIDKFDALNEQSLGDDLLVRKQTEASSCILLAMAKVGHYTQSYDSFLHWNWLHFQEQLNAYRCGRSEDPRNEWFSEQEKTFNEIISPLISCVESMLPAASYLRNNAETNLELWGQHGRNWLTANLLPSAMVGDRTGLNESSPQDHLEELISANTCMLESLLRDVAATRENGTALGNLSTHCAPRKSNPYDEIQLVLTMVSEGSDTPTKACTNACLPPIVRAELRDFVVAIAAGYQNNEFHNFQHASHVAHLSNILVKTMKKDESGIVFDPLSRFAIVLSALVHDIGHTGVPNCRLAEENPDLALQYDNKSIAEQNSVDTAWSILMTDSFRNLRRCLFQSTEEENKLRQLVVNCVMSTDIFDKELKALRQSRWEKVQEERASFSTVHEEKNCKATCIVEHIVQASDIAHTMQEWEIYRQWNEQLFQELYSAFMDGREEIDPSEGWYKGELLFFDNWVLPLAQNLKDCGVWKDVSEELIKQAANNRSKWAKEGEDICRKMLGKVKEVRSHRVHCADTKSSDGSATAETMLTSQMVNEIESLSRVMKRYERKMETACGNLIAVAYKGKSGTNELRKQSWPNVRQHFRQKQWYKMSNSDDDISCLSYGSVNLHEQLSQAEFIINGSR